MRSSACIYELGEKVKLITPLDTRNRVTGETEIMSEGMISQVWFLSDWRMLYLVQQGDCAMWLYDYQLTPVGLIPCGDIVCVTEVTA